MEKITRLAVVRILTGLYACASVVEVIAEYFYDVPLIWSSKPFMIPLLALLYWFSSRRPNYVFLVALSFSWVANMFFISRELESVAIGAMIFLAYRLIILYVVLRIVSFRGFLPVVLGALPMVVIYLYVIDVTYETIGAGLPMFIAQGIFISLMSGIAVGNYVFKPNKANTLLLISTMMFAFTQFIFVIRLFYVNLNIFQPIAMALFAIGQFILCKFVLIAERKMEKVKPPQHDRLKPKT